MCSDSPDASMCPITHALLRMEDCALDARFVQIAHGSILHVSQPSKVSIALPPGWDGNLTVNNRVKVSVCHYSVKRVSLRMRCDMRGA